MQNIVSPCFLTHGVQYCRSKLPQQRITPFTKADDSVKVPSKVKAEVADVAVQICTGTLKNFQGTHI